MAKPPLGLVASKGLRENNEKYRKSQRSVDAFVAEFLDVLSHYHLLVTRGTFIDVFADGAKVEELKNKGGSEDVSWAYADAKFARLEGEVLRNGKDGGLIQLASRLLPQRGEDPKCDVVVFLMDSQDTEEQFPENRQIIRIASQTGAFLHLNYSTAAMWATNELREYGFDPKTKVGHPPRGPNDTIALISHDAGKLDMCKLVAKYHWQLAGFGKIIATGTTGRYVQNFLQLFGDAADKVDKQLSGPLGGDAQIARLIMEGDCQHVCFFLDPATAHPHEADVYALLRACTFEGCEVNLRISPASAASWLDSVST